MKKVAIYPFDKVTRGLIKFRSELNIQICTVIDFIFNIGEDAGVNADGKYSGIPITNDIEKALEGVDALIINSMSAPFFIEKYRKIYQENDVEKKWKQLVIKAKEKGLEIISVHEIAENADQWLQENNIKIVTFDKSEEEMDAFIEEKKKVVLKDNAHRIAIYATRGCVGKYTAQMYLLKAMKKRNMKAAALVTEPVGSFYGQYDADPARLHMLADPMKYVKYVETLARQAEMDGNEYIIYADQQNLTKHYFIEEIASKLSFLKLYHPDSIFLVAGYEDDTEIRDCLDIIRIYGDGKKPVSILIPDRVEVTYGQYEVKTKEEIELRKKELKNSFHIDSIELVSDVEKLIEKITN